jgi:hypothetical protein
MYRPRSIARIDYVVCVSRVGQTLRWATQDVAHEDLPPDIKRLLGRLDRLEAREAKRDESEPDDGAER